MTLVYNTLTGQKEEFIPLETSKVKMYCCGITTYDYCHVGHARTFIVWDTVRNYLKWLGYEVQYVQNFTDIDDKIIKRAMTESVSMENVSERFIKAYFEDMELLNIKKANAYPRATHTLDGIKKLITELEEKGFAYPTNGDVYFRVRQVDEICKLSGHRLESLQTEANEIKDDPLDFALWKGAKPNEPSWDSPWGKGRPGWHIECSAMIREELGETIDIHVGGNDLIFPHHENEIAQSEAANGKPLAKYWLHNGMVKVNGEKMSKSTGNFTTIRDLLKKYDPMAVRLFTLQAHYRSPLNFTEEALDAAANGWNKLKEALLWGYELNWPTEIPPIEGRDVRDRLRNSIPHKWRQSFLRKVRDDFNFTASLADIFQIAKKILKQKNLFNHKGATTSKPYEIVETWQILVELTGVLGLVIDPKTLEYLESEQRWDESFAKSAEVLEKLATEAMTEYFAGKTIDVDRLVQQREVARQQKNYTESDRIRNELKKQNIVLIDTKDGKTTWYKDNQTP